MTDIKRPRVNIEGQRELDKVENQTKQFTDSIKQASEDRQMAPLRETEPQLKISQSELNASKTIYLKPKRTFPSREKFNERFREEYDRQREYVEFIAENNEIKEESIDFCIKKFPGMPVEEWVVPVNKVVSAPLYIRERIEECGYTVFITADRQIGSEGGVTYFGQMVAEERRSRLSARSISRNARIFTGNHRFIA